MKKLLSILAVALMANVAMAGAGFTIPGADPIEIPQDGSVEVLIATNGGASGGMSLYLQAIGGFEIAALDAADFEGSFWKVGTTATYEQVDIYPIGAFGPSSYGVADVGSPSNTTLQAGTIMAKVTISAAGLPVGTVGTLTTAADVNPSSLAGGDTAQATIGLVVTPEPVTALLLLAGLPLIRRRRA